LVMPAPPVTSNYLNYPEYKILVSYLQVCSCVLSRGYGWGVAGGKVMG
jgi:hypothetical protein